MAMKLYVAATRQNDGKTITCLGLIAALKKRLPEIGYMKPVGQRYVEVEGHKIDEDAVLVKRVYGLPGDMPDMSPIAITRHFTENYIDNPHHDSLVASVHESFDRIAAGKDLVLVEGTGHAGVGSVFDMSNGDVASMLGCKVLVVSSGGVGRPIDEIMLNKVMFDSMSVPILGAVINKVQPDKYDKIVSYVSRGLERKGMETIGVMPFTPILSSPTIEQLFEDIEGEVLGGEEGMRNVVGKMVIGAMPPHHALEYMDRDVLLITPGTREDLILAAMSFCILDGAESHHVAGIILTGGTPPARRVADLVRRTCIPTILVDEDTYTVASRIDKLIVKIRSEDTEKIRAAEDMIDRYIDIDRILEALS